MTDRHEHQSGDSTGADLGTIAFFGLGRMGLPMAARLAAAGWIVLGFDPFSEAVQRAIARGIRPGEDLARARDADVIVTMLPDDHVVQSMMLDAEGLVATVGTGTLWLEMTSSHPATTRRLAEVLAERGCDLLDAPVSGGVRGAETGTLTVLAGGPLALVERARPILNVLSGTVVRVGDRPGDGDLAKSLNNMLSAINLTAASEAMALAAQAGLDLEAFAQAVADSSGGSHAMAVKVAQFALRGRFNAGFTIDQYCKDLRIALSTFEQARVASRLGDATQSLWRKLAAEGHGADDHTRVVALLGGLGADHEDAASGTSALRG